MKLLDDRGGGYAILATPHVDAAQAASLYPLSPFIAAEKHPYPRRWKHRVTAIDLGNINVLRKLLTTSSLTFAMPRPISQSLSAAEYETSTTRPGMNEPRSLARTVTDRPVAMLVARN